jgi:ribosomal protein L7Ae-like RNA K-turn-binding protein
MDRYRGWLVVIMGTTGFDVTKFLAKLCEEYGVPVSCTSDGG